MVLKMYNNYKNKDCDAGIDILPCYSHLTAFMSQAVNCSENKSKTFKKLFFLRRSNPI